LQLLIKVMSVNTSVIDGVRWLVWEDIFFG